MSPCDGRPFASSPLAAWQVEALSSLLASCFGGRWWLPSTFGRHACTPIVKRKKSETPNRYPSVYHFISRSHQQSTPSDFGVLSVRPRYAHAFLENIPPTTFRNKKIPSLQYRFLPVDSSHPKTHKLRVSRATESSSSPPILREFDHVSPPLGQFFTEGQPLCISCWCLLAVRLTQFLFCHCWMVLCIDLFAPSKTLKGFHDTHHVRALARRIKVLIIGLKRSLQDFEGQLSTRLRTRVLRSNAPSSAL